MKQPRVKMCTMVIVVTLQFIKKKNIFDLNNALPSQENRETGKIHLKLEAVFWNMALYTIFDLQKQLKVVKLALVA